MEALKQTEKSYALAVRLIRFNPALLALAFSSTLAVLSLAGVCAAPLLAQSRHLVHAWSLMEQGGSDRFSLAKGSEVLQRLDDGLMRARPMRRTELLARIALFLLLAPILAAYFDAAQAGAAAQALRGRRVGFGEALAAAWARRRDVAVWGLTSWGAGWLMRGLESHWEDGAHELMRTAGMGNAPCWNTATLLAVPVLAAEGGLPRPLLARSAQLVRERWEDSRSRAAVGRTLVLGVLFLAGAAAAFAFIGRAFLAGSLPGVLTGAALLAAVVATVRTWGCIVDTMFSAALYLHAVEGHVPLEFWGESQGWFSAARLEAPPPGAGPAL